MLLRSRDSVAARASSLNKESKASTSQFFVASNAEEELLSDVMIAQFRFQMSELESEFIV